MKNHGDYGYPSTSGLRQRGAALITALVFLMILTVLGLAAMNTTALEEKMAHNAKDRNVAFQAAESALKVGENWIGTRLGAPLDFPDNANAKYEPSDTVVPVWESVNWSLTTNLRLYPNTPEQTASGSLAKVATQPKYIVEYLGPVPDPSGSLVLSPIQTNVRHFYRVTARGTGGTDVSVVMVQSTYARYP